MQRRFLVPAMWVTLGVMGNLLASTIDSVFHISRPGRLSIQIITIIAAILLTMLLEGGVKMPGAFTYHRFCYLSDLRRSKILRQWALRFVPLQLGPAPRYVAVAEVLEEGERRDLVDMLTKSLTKSRSRGRRILVLGEPGSGKTTAIERVAYELAGFSFRSIGLRGPIPVLIRAGDQRTSDSVETLVADGVSHWARGSSRRFLTDAHSVRKLADGPQIVLLIDAIDELSGQRRESLLEALSSLASSGGFEHLSIVVTCRTRQDPQNALPDYETYSILDLSDDSVAAFISVYCQQPGVDWTNTYTRLQESGFLGPGGLARNPFWLKQLIASGANEKTRSGILRLATADSFIKELSKPRSALRDWVCPPNYSNEQIIEFCIHALSVLAKEMGLQRNIARRSARIKLSEWMKGASGETADLSLSADDVIGLGIDSGLLHKSFDPILFSHRLLQEYFTAFALLNWQKDSNGWLQQYINDASYWQTLALLGGMYPSGPDSLVQTVLGDKPNARQLACAIAIYVGNNRIPEGPMSGLLVRRIRLALGQGANIEADLHDSLREFLVMGQNLAASFLSPLLVDRDIGIRLRTCQLLGVSGTSTAAHLLASFGLADEDSEIARIASEALAQMGELGFWQAIRRLESSKPSTRRWAALTLARIADPDALGYLLAVGEDQGIDAPLTHTSPEDAAALERAISLCGRQRVGTLLAALAFSSGSHRLRILRALKSATNVRVLRVFARYATDSDASVREAALDGLQGLALAPVSNEGQDSAVSALELAMQFDSNAVQTDTAKILAKLDGKEGVRVLIRLAEIGNLSAMSALSDVCGSEGLRLLFDFLTTAKEPFRERLLHALAVNPCADVEPILFERAESSHASHRSAAIRCLAERQLAFRRIARAVADSTSVPTLAVANSRVAEDAPSNASGHEVGDTG